MKAIKTLLQKEEIKIKSKDFKKATKTKTKKEGKTSINLDTSKIDKVKKVDYWKIIYNLGLNKFMEEININATLSCNTFTMSVFGLIKLYKPSKKDLYNKDHCHFFPNSKLIIFVKNQAYFNEKFPKVEGYNHQHDGQDVFFSFKTTKEVKNFFNQLSKVK